MFDDDLAFEVGPGVPRQGIVGDPNQEVALVLHDVLSVGQLQRDLAAGNFRTDALPPQAGFLEQLAQGRLLQRLAVLDAATRRAPEVLAGERPALVDEAEQQDPARPVEDQQPRGQSPAHGRLGHRARIGVGAADQRRDALAGGAAYRRRTSGRRGPWRRPARRRSAALPTARAAPAHGVVADQHRVAHQLLRDLEIGRADAAGAQRIGGDAGDVHVDRTAGAQRLVQRRRALGLDGDDPACPRRSPPRSRRSTRRRPPPPAACRTSPARRTPARRCRRRRTRPHPHRPARSARRSRPRASPRPRAPRHRRRRPDGRSRHSSSAARPWSARRWSARRSRPCGRARARHRRRRRRGCRPRRR